MGVIQSPGATNRQSDGFQRWGKELEGIDFDIGSRDDKFAKIQVKCENTMESVEDRLGFSGKFLIDVLDYLAWSADHKLL